MNTFLTYIIEVNLVLAILYMCYALICKHTTFFALRRLTLLLIWIAAFIIPIIKVKPIFETNSLQHTARIEKKNALNTAPALPTVMVEQALQEIKKQENGWLHSLVSVYATVVLLLLGRQLLQVFSLMKIHKKSKKVLYNKQTPICLLTGSDASFSFFKWIFIYAADFQKGMADEIIRHEITHARQWHSIDVCVGQILVALNWFNPFAHLMMIEVRRNLEYLADRGTLVSGSAKKEYQMNLLKLTYRISPCQIYNSFNYSHLKERIIMMNKKPSDARQRYAYLLLVVPMMAFPLLGVFAKQQTDIPPTSDVETEERLNIRSNSAPIRTKKISQTIAHSEKLQIKEATTDSEKLQIKETAAPVETENLLVETAQTHSKTEHLAYDKFSNKGIEGTWIIVSPDSSVVNYKVLTADKKYINLRSRDGGKTYQITRRGFYDLQGDDVYVEDLKQEFNFSVSNTRINFKYKIKKNNLFLSFNLRGQELNEIWQRVETE